MSVLGRVEELWVFPVKSMSGARVERAEVAAGGLVGDREWAVVDRSGATVTAKQEPRLREAVARLVGDDLSVEVPGAGAVTGADAVGAGLSAWLGRPLHLEHRPGTGFVDVAPVHLVSTASMADAAHAEECDACDVSAPRANLVLDLAPGQRAERDWVGTGLVVGTAGLTVATLPRHCLGAYADVVAPGLLHVGDEVRTG